MTIKINGHVLPDELVEAEIARLIKVYSKRMSEEEIRNNLSNIKRQAKDFAIGRFLLHVEAMNRKIEPDDSAIQEALAFLKEQEGGEEKFYKNLEQTKHTEKDIREVIRAALQVDMLVRDIVSDMDVPTEDEIEDYYEANQHEFQQPESAHISHILIKPESEVDRAVVISKLLEIKDKIKQGADFAEMAAIYSQCPTGKESGGDFGVIQRGTLVPAFDNATFSMETGEISEPIETQFGFHIIYKKAHFPPHTLSLEEASEAISKKLIAIWQNDLLEDFIDGLKRAVHIEDTENQ
jgi:peptidyl-prolyl cis-trans isomerase C